MVQILYEDNHIIVAIKPKGVLSQADGSSKEDMLTILKDYIKNKYNKPGQVYLGLVHRLDTNTSGVMVFARTSKAAARLSDAIQKHEFHKHYYATVEGRLEGVDVQVVNYLWKDEKEKKSYVREDGQKSSLRYTTIQSYEKNGQMVTDLDILLETGRFHQIRCQMANLGHPLYGDRKYGSKAFTDSLDFPLCAYQLSFPHPITKEVLTFTMEVKA